MKRLIIVAGILCLANVSAHAETTAFVGARIHPVDAAVIDDGVLLVEDGRIRAVGPRGSVPVPADATVVDVAGKVIIPGLVDTHSHVGEVSGGDGSAPIQPEARVLDSINVRDAGFRRAVAGGLTSLNIMPGSGHLMSGQTIYVKLRGGNTIEDIAYRRDDGAIAGGVLVNYAKTVLTGLIPEIWLFALGGMFIAVTLFFPKGLVGSIPAAIEWVKTKAGGGGSAASAPLAKEAGE